MAAGWAAGLLTGGVFAAFLLLAIGVSMLLSINALLLEEIAFHMHRPPGQLARLVIAAIWENLGYRQLDAVGRMRGLFDAALGARSTWGEMKRTATWQQDNPLK